MKNAPEGIVANQPSWSPHHRDDVNTHVRDIVEPELATRIGLRPSDMSCPRNKDQMQRIFEKVLSKDEFEGIWQCLNKNQENKKPDQEEMASVAQFRAEILKISAS